MHMDKTGAITGANSRIIGGSSGQASDSMQGNALPPQASLDDTFSQAGVPCMKSISSQDIAASLLREKGLEKHLYDYGISSHTSGPDGTIYIAYSDSNKDEGNYISAVSPGGEVTWELSPGKEGLKEIHSAPDGTVIVRTKESLAGFAPDGTSKFRFRFDGEVRSLLTDSGGTSYLWDVKGNSLLMIDSSGEKKEPPAGLKGIKPDLVKVENGAIYCKEGLTITRAGLDDSQKVEEVRLKRNDGSTWDIEDFQPTSDGGMMVLARKSTYIPFTHALHTDFLMGGFGPHLPADAGPEYFGTQAMETHLVRLDRKGNTKWESENIGIGPRRNLFLPGDRFIYSTEKMGEDGKVAIMQRNAKGDENLFASVDAYVTTMQTRESDNHVFITHGSRISEFESSGALVRTMNTDSLKSCKTLTGFSREGMLIMSDGVSKKRLTLWDWSTGAEIPLTDHKSDHSYKLAARQMDLNDDAAENMSGIEVAEEEVNIAGVTLPIQKNMKPQAP